MNCRIMTLRAALTAARLSRCGVERASALHSTAVTFTRGNYQATAVFIIRCGSPRLVDCEEGRRSASRRGGDLSISIKSSGIVMSGAEVATLVRITRPREKGLCYGAIRQSEASIGITTAPLQAEAEEISHGPTAPAPIPLMAENAITL